MFCCKRRRAVTVTNQLMASDDDTRKFTLSGLVARAKCVKVHDGDSVHLVMIYNGALTRFACRLKGIDAAELRGGTVEAKRARDYLRDLIYARLVEVTCFDFDKYGRLLVDIYSGGVNINQKMITDGYARPYDGGRKET